MATVATMFDDWTYSFRDFHGPDLADQGREKIFEWGSRKGWVGTLYARALRGYNFFLMGTQGAREIASDVHLDGRTRSREIPGGGKGLNGYSISTYVRYQ